jgi:O-antigen/teichoic acid export membrane protein
MSAMAALDLTTESGRARERFRRAALTTLASAASRGLSLGTNLISIPLTLNYLGPERFGLWVTIASANTLLDFADLGISNGLMNSIAGAIGEGDRARIRTAVSSAFFLLLGIGMVVAVLFLGLAPLLPWGRIFPAARPELLSEAVRACGVFAACFALNLPMGIVRRVQLGFQEGFLSNLWQCLASVLSLLALLLAIRMKAGLPLLVLGLTGAPLFALTLNWLHEFVVIRPWLRPAWSSFRWQTGRTLVHSGLLFVCMQISFLLFTVADPIIAATYLGLTAAAGFAVAQRLFLFQNSLQSLWLAPLWPAYAEAWARGDVRWVRRTLLRSALLAAASAAAVGLVLVVFRARIFPAWLRRDWFPPLSLSLGLALSMVALSTGSAFSMFLNGVNAIRQQAATTVAVMVLVTLLKVVLCRQLGDAGIPWGFVLGYVPIMAPFLWWLTRSLLRTKGESYA